MVKKLMTKATAAKAIKTKRKRSGGEDSLDEHGRKAAHMLYDPCGAELSPGVYPGDAGYINRFNSRFNVGSGAGETAALVLFKPGNNIMYSAGAAASSTVLTVSYVDTLAPGAGFLNSNATKTRCVGSCIVVQPNVAPNNATGFIHYGVIPASALAQSSTPTIDAVIPYLNQSVSVAQAVLNPLEVKWSPGAFDDRYSPTTGVTSDDDTDRNLLVLAVTGMVVATGISCRLTAIYEWAPTPNINVSLDGTQVAPSKCDIGCVLRNLKRKDANWWWHLGSKVGKAAMGIGASYASGGALGVATLAMSSFK